MLRTVAFLVFAIGALGIVASLLAGMQIGTSATSAGCGVANSGTATSNTVNCGPPPAIPSAKP